MLRAFFLIAVYLIFQQSAFAGDTYTPKRGSSERKAIMNAARKPIMAELNGQYVVFVVRKLRVSGQWAYLEAEPRLRNGRKVNYNITKFRNDIKEGFFDDWLGVLLKRAGRGWRPVTHTIGSTDYPVVVWPEKFGAPRALIF